MRVHPGINFSCLQIDGNLAGMIFVCASIFVLVGGLGLELFFVGSLAGGAVIAALLILFHQHVGRHANDSPAQLFLTTPKAADDKTARGLSSPPNDSLAVAL